MSGSTQWWEVLRKCGRADSIPQPLRVLNNSRSFVEKNFTVPLRWCGFTPPEFLPGFHRSRCNKRLTSGGTGTLREAPRGATCGIKSMNRDRHVGCALSSHAAASVSCVCEGVKVIFVIRKKSSSPCVDHLPSVPIVSSNRCVRINSEWWDHLAPFKNKLVWPWEGERLSPCLASL